MSRGVVDKCGLWAPIQHGCNLVDFTGTNSIIPGHGSLLLGVWVFSRSLLINVETHDESFGTEVVPQHVFHSLQASDDSKCGSSREGVPHCRRVGNPLVVSLVFSGCERLESDHDTLPPVHAHNQS